MNIKLLIVVIVASLVVFNPLFAAEEKLVSPSFDVGQLKEGGYVVFFRHTKRDDVPSTAKLDELDRVSSCESGGSLNSEGEAEARAIARGIQKRAIPAGEVFASPTCRTKQMARILVGDRFKIEKTLAPESVREASQASQDAEALKKLLSSEVPAGSNRFLISHGKIMKSSTIGIDVSLEQSQAAVFRPDGKEGFEFLGIIRPEDWSGSGVSAGGTPHDVITSVDTLHNSK